MNWLYYLAEANIYLGVFYLSYCLFLNRDTHYQLSRAYLVSSCILAFLLPVLQIGALRPVKLVEAVRVRTSAAIPATIGVVHPHATATATKTTATISLSTTTPATVTKAATTATATAFTLQRALYCAYILGAAVLFVLFILKLHALWRLIRNAQSVKGGKYRLITLAGTDIAFSFFNFVFIGADAPRRDTMIRHELVHTRQKHSADVIFLELLKIINWFNPCVYLLQNSLKTIHEYIADEQTAAFETDAITYASFLLKNAYGAAGSSLTHSFFNYNLLKKRIIMLNKQRSGNLARLKYLVAVPVCGILLCTSTLVFSKSYGWVDLAPAVVRSAGSDAMVNANHAIKHKRLKITQNGITTISDQLAVPNDVGDQTYKKVVYTSATITATDRSLLLKNHNIKVEVVDDSTRFTTRDGQLILPIVNVDGYYLLDYFLHHNVHYTAARGERGGLVEVGFILNKDRRITNAEIVKSGGAKLDALALNGFNTYQGVVNDDPGKRLKIGVYFFTDDYSIFKTDSLEQDPEFGGELIIPDHPYPVKITSKGYEYDEGSMGFPGDASLAKVIIYDKNGGGNWFYKNKCTPADLEMLKVKFGYTFPSGTSPVIEFMQPKNGNNRRLAFAFDVASYLDTAYANQFYNHIMNNIQYPEQAKKSLKGGVVLLNFKLDNQGIISGVTVAQSGSKDFDEAAMNALRSYKSAIKDNSGKHSIALVFCVAEKKYRPVVSEKIKKDGYVGELAVCDVKSPIVSGSAMYMSTGTAAPNPNVH